MSELSRSLFLAGGLPFLILGIAHAVITPHTPGRPKPLSPRDAGVRESMANATLFIARLNLWRAWVGFNLSHSLGAILFGATVLVIGRSSSSFETQAPLFVPLAFVVSATYLVLALRYWFRIPIIGIALSCLLFLMAWLN